MQTQDYVKTKGDVYIIRNNSLTGQQDAFEFKNLVTTVGKQWIASRLKDTGIPSQPSHMAVGSNNTAANIADTILGTETGRSSLGTAGGVVTGAVVSYTASFPEGVGTGNVYEAGLFNDPTAGVLILHTVFGLVTKNAFDSFSITWNLTIL